jgi:hypothetical protein
MPFSFHNILIKENWKIYELGDFIPPEVLFNEFNPKFKY